MKITDEMVEAAAAKTFWHRWGVGWEEATPGQRQAYLNEAREVLEAAFTTLPQRFCTATLNCPLADGHKGVCPR